MNILIIRRLYAPRPPFCSKAAGGERGAPPTISATPLFVAKRHRPEARNAFCGRPILRAFRNCGPLAPEVSGLELNRALTHSPGR
jgi:hypothetical protein